MQFKRMSMVVLMCAALMADAMADDAMPLAFDVIFIKERPLENKEIRIALNKQQNGVFVLAAGSTRFPNTTRLIRDMMAAKGVKVADDPASADIGLQFANIAGLSLADVEKQASSLDGGKIGSGIGAVIGREVFGLSEKLKPIASQPVTAMFSVLLADKPSVNASNKLDGANKISILSTIRYQAMSEGADASTAAFVAFVDDFIKHHFVVDAPVTLEAVTDAPASAAPAIETPLSAEPASAVPATPSSEAASAVTDTAVVHDLKK